MSALAPTLQSFFTERLARQRQASPRTVASYRDTFRLLVSFVERQTGKILSSLGEIGNLPGQFNQAHSIAMDSRSNLYVVENRGRRIHKFKPVSQ